MIELSFPPMQPEESKTNVRKIELNLIFKY